MVSFRFTAGYWFKGQAPQRQNAITFNIEQGIRENKSIKAIQDRLRARGLGYREERMRTDIQKARTIEWSKTHESYNRARAFHRAAREYQQEKGIRYYSEAVKEYRHQLDLGIQEEQERYIAKGEDVGIPEKYPKKR